jgi:hypothetical protein
MPAHNPIDREASGRRKQKSRSSEQPLVRTLSDAYYAHWRKQKVLAKPAYAVASHDNSSNCRGKKDPTQGPGQILSTTRSQLTLAVAMLPQKHRACLSSSTLFEKKTIDECATNDQTAFTIAYMPQGIHKE